MKDCSDSVPTVALDGFQRHLRRKKDLFGACKHEFCLCFYACLANTMQVLLSEHLALNEKKCQQIHQEVHQTQSFFCWIQKEAEVDTVCVPAKGNIWRQHLDAIAKRSGCFGHIQQRCRKLYQELSAFTVMLPSALGTPRLSQEVKRPREQLELTLGLSVVSDPRRLPQDMHSTTHMCTGFLGWEEEEHVSIIFI